MQASIVEKNVRLSRADIIRYQLITHCFIRKIKLSESDIRCITMLALQKGEQLLNEFCRDHYAALEYKNDQQVRNCLNRAEKLNLIIKQGKNRKKVYLNPALNIRTEGNIFLNYKLLYAES